MNDPTRTTKWTALRKMRKMLNVHQHLLKKWTLRMVLQQGSSAR
jgi:hypothetical protein